MCKDFDRQPEIPVNDLDAAWGARHDEDVGGAEVAMDAVRVHSSHSRDETDDQVTVHMQFAEAFAHGREEDVLHGGVMGEDLWDVRAGWCGVEQVEDGELVGDVLRVERPILVRRALVKLQGSSLASIRRTHAQYDGE